MLSSMIEYYVLSTGRKLVKVPMVIWERWMGANLQACSIGHATVGTVRISTVLLGLRVLPGGPQLFETMIFGGDHAGTQWRYDTLAEAEAGHAVAVKFITESLPVLSDD